MWSRDSTGSKGFPNGHPDPASPMGGAHYVDMIRASAATGAATTPWISLNWSGRPQDSNPIAPSGTASYRRERGGYRVSPTGTFGRVDKSDTPTSTVGSCYI